MKTGHATVIGSDCDGKCCEQEEDDSGDPHVLSIISLLILNASRIREMSNKQCVMPPNSVGCPLQCVFKTQNTVSSHGTDLHCTSQLPLFC